MTEQKNNTAHITISYFRAFISSSPAIALSMLTRERALTDLAQLEGMLNSQSASISALKEQVKIASGAAMKASGYLDSIIAAIETTTHGKNCAANYADETAFNVISAIHKTESAYREALRTAEAFQKTRLKVEPTSDLFDAYSYAYFTHYAPSPGIYGLTSRRSGKATYVQYMTISSEIIDEAIRASKIHPKWPTDVVHAVSILTEESGELMKAAIEYHYNNGDIEAVREEAIQTGAMALRVLMNIDKYNRPSDKK